MKLTKQLIVKIIREEVDKNIILQKWITSGLLNVDRIQSFTLKIEEAPVEELQILFDHYSELLGQDIKNLRSPGVSNYLETRFRDNMKFYSALKKELDKRNNNL